MKGVRLGKLASGVGIAAAFLAGCSALPVSPSKDQDDTVRR